MLQPLMKRVLSLTPACYHVNHKRKFFGMLNAIFNKVDQERIKEVGAERACAEWLLRCGVEVRWKDSNKFHKDYNSLPPEKLHKFVIEEINAHEAAVMEIGFPHFVGCNHIKKIRFYHCPYLEDGALQQLGILKDSLEHLEIGSCGDITDAGVLSLGQLRLLQSLLLYDLPEVRNKTACYQRLKEMLPKCDITYRDVHDTE